MRVIRENKKKEHKLSKLSALSCQIIHGSFGPINSRSSGSLYRGTAKNGTLIVETIINRHTYYTMDDIWDDSTFLLTIALWSGLLVILKRKQRKQRRFWVRPIYENRC